MKISKNFTLDEFLVSGYAERNDIDMTPPPAVKRNIRKLVRSVLQPVRTRVRRSVHVTSGYRPPKLNRGIGGARKSQHLVGAAADCKVVRQAPYDTCRLIIRMKLPFDQLIHEFGRWVHVSVATGGKKPRGEVLTAYRHKGKTKYIHGLHTMEPLL